MSCKTYCSHGGSCILKEDHEGLHDSEYCKWTDEESISKELANERILEKEPFLGPMIVRWRNND